MNDLDQQTFLALLEARDALTDALLRTRPSKERRAIYTSAHAKVAAAIDRLRKERP